MKRLSNLRFGRLPLRAGGFTLVEMLVVLAIMAILAVLSAPAVTGMLGSMNLKGASSTVVSQFDLARQTAQTRNLRTELRIYLDSNTKDIYAAGKNAYRYIAVVIPAAASGAATDEFVSPGSALPGDIIFDQTFTSGSNYSSMLDPSQVDGTGTTRTLLLEALTAPLQVRKLQYQRISFMPNGSVNLSPPTTTSSTIWCLTLRSNKAGPYAGPPVKPAKNFATLVLDPNTGRVRLYQP